MKANNRLNIPKKLKVGFQKRTDTYSGKLAYVTYINKKGEIAKDKSWRGWIHDEEWCKDRTKMYDQYISQCKDDKVGKAQRERFEKVREEIKNEVCPIEDYDNVPTSGFVFNKHVGGHKSGWEFRHSYCRVFDPRGFEIEIGMENLLYILENCDCYKGKGIDGEFVYAWDKAELVLLPVNSVDYKESSALISKQEELKNADLIVNTRYHFSDDTTGVYIGKYRIPYMRVTLTEYTQQEKHKFFRNYSSYYYNKHRYKTYIPDGALLHVFRVDKADDSFKFIAYKDIKNKIDYAMESDCYDKAEFADIDEKLLVYTHNNTKTKIRECDTQNIEMGRNTDLIHKYINCELPFGADLSNMKDDAVFSLSSYDRFAKLHIVRKRSETEYDVYDLGLHPCVADKLDIGNKTLSYGHEYPVLGFCNNAIFDLTDTEARKDGHNSNCFKKNDIARVVDEQKKLINRLKYELSEDGVNWFITNRLATTSNYSFYGFAGQVSLFELNYVNTYIIDKYNGKVIVKKIDVPKLGLNELLENIDQCDVYAVEPCAGSVYNEIRYSSSANDFNVYTNNGLMSIHERTLDGNLTNTTFEIK